MNQNLLFCMGFSLLILCIVNAYVTDVIVTWSVVIGLFSWLDVKPLECLLNWFFML